ncbi:hypothetical protein [Botrimarina mediterranea]|uniref:Uncharacterized protein n=1 Tax=Botrimarina mediterranea TaxID=2528022 RepID=A0A518K4J2_9BACT|nr:hypothetical protein [Botrimarina mediterranea]QDV72718.1 hypothetical protein Spa11_09000 [Botrimarina mediterranea]QDV77291.1 hypothetical protein K2D_08820 [Planctomycetes bacterium K2D]
MAQDPVDEVLDVPTSESQEATSEAEEPAAETEEPMVDGEAATPEEPVEDAAEAETEMAEEPAAIEPEEPAPLDESEPAVEEAVEELEDEAADGAEVAEDEAMEDEAMEEAEAEEPEAAATDWGGIIERAPAFFAKTHHAVVHLPIALWVFGALFVVIGVVIPSWRTQIPLACLVGGALTSVAAVASGWWYAEFDYGAPWAWGDGFGDWSEHLVRHRWYGFGLAAASIVLSIIALISQARQSKGLGAFWRLGLIGLALAVAWEGHLGGEMIHGEGFMEEAFQEWVSPAAEE